MGSALKLLARFNLIDMFPASRPAKDVFSAGSETSGTTTIWAMSELVKNPSLMEQAQAEVRHVLHGKSTVKEAYIQGKFPFLQMVIKETLRMHPPGPLLLPRSF
ncbi:hypothetical protein PR202_ga17264 [Eleusine coracana subsp. coracana]|uniref:Uncharacterized protein n=1 Tax=Eleusine coracana subsp. coracana TaxID=191504 RepID=A0AAV5CNH6_ELECO|nr:hypothetical protein PR202_ga17264 [Eleusine coracana subsp. coracana]